MEARLNLVVFACLIVASMLHSSVGQTTHVVGDVVGWVVPPGGESTYRTWTATKTFIVGDVLVFNFPTNRHNVAEVSTDAFNSCNTTDPISVFAAGPTNITLRSAGEHHFICTVASHCSMGQKLAINVFAAPAPKTSPSPPTLSPSRVGMTYTVGDGLGWVLPLGGPIAYQTWVRGNNFMVGDTLVFNFMSGAHDVMSVTKAEFESCTISTTTTPPTTTSPARITLTSGGEHYYICTFTQHCLFGQKLAINVTGDATSTPPSSATPSTPSPISAPPPAPTSSAPSYITPASPFTSLVVVLAFFWSSVLFFYLFV